MKFLKITMYIIELIGLILYLLVNHLANTNLRIMKDAVYRNSIISSSNLSEKITFFMLIAFFVLVAINVVLISRKSYKCVQDIYISVLMLVASAATIKCFNVRNLFTYYYLLLAMLVVLACEVVKIAINLRYKISLSTKI